MSTDPNIELAIATAEGFVAIAPSPWCEAFRAIAQDLRRATAAPPDPPKMCRAIARAQEISDAAGLRAHAVAWLRQAAAKLRDGAAHAEEFGLYKAWTKDAAALDFAIAATLAHAAPPEADRTAVWIRVERGEGYEDVHPELVADDFVSNAGRGFSWSAAHPPAAAAPPRRDEDAEITAALDCRPFAESHNDGRRTWQFFPDNRGVDALRAGMKVILDAARNAAPPADEAGKETT